MTAVLGLLTAFAWATSNVFTQKMSRTGAPTSAVMFWILVVVTATIVPVAIAVDGVDGPWNAHAVAWPVAGGVLATIALAFLMRALRTGSLSVVAPIIALEGGIATAMSVALGERPSVLQYALLALAIVGALLVSLEPGRRTAAGAVPAVLAAVGYAGLLVALGESPLPDLTTVALSRGTTMLVLLPAFLLVARLPDRSTALMLIPCGVLDAVGYSTFALAASIGPISVASVAATQWGTAAALIGIVFLHERLHHHQYIGIVITLSAVTGLGLLG